MEGGKGVQVIFVENRTFTVRKVHSSVSDFFPHKYGAVGKINGNVLRMF